MEKQVIETTNNPLISVIVPIYKVEPYISRCIDSIINQSYRNIEIILVDDGSPDNCGSICDEYARNDHRIVVIHRPNGGLSAARNSGLDRCTGEYIGFVDSDDFIHPEMYQRLYEDIIKHHVKLAFCHPNMCRKSVPAVDVFQPTECKDKEFVILQSITKEIWWSAWTKLYHRSLFDNIRFPEGKTNEDYPTTIRIYDLCENIAVNYNKLYNYCIRENSICTSSLNIRKFDQITTTWDVLQYMEQKPILWKKAAEFVFMTTLLRLLGDIYNHPEMPFDRQRQDIFLHIKKHFASSVKNPYILKKQKIMLLSARIHPLLYHMIHKLYNCIQSMKK